MLQFTVNMIVKNGHDYMEACIRQFIPFAEKILVFVDDTSTDNSYEIAKSLPITAILYHVDNREKDGLVVMRNDQIKYSSTEYIWIVDDDEYYPSGVIERILRQIEVTNKDTYTVKFWHLYDENWYHRTFSRKNTLKIFRRKNTVMWKGLFGKEVLCDGDTLLFVNATCLGDRFIHFSMLKSYSWRKEFNAHYTIDGKNNLNNLPQEIYEIVQNVQRETVHTRN